MSSTQGTPKNRTVVDIQPVMAEIASSNSIVNQHGGARRIEAAISPGLAVAEIGEKGRCGAQPPADGVRKREKCDPKRPHASRNTISAMTM